VNNNNNNNNNDEQASNSIHSPPDIRNDGFSTNGHAADSRGCDNDARTGMGRKGNGRLQAKNGPHAHPIPHYSSARTHGKMETRIHQDIPSRILCLG
jgi:hypothetical protein